MASSLSQLSASVTRILSLTGFPKELKTRDIQLAFSEWENANGGFKIKWIDDTSLLIVFADATVGEHPITTSDLHVHRRLGANDTILRGQQREHIYPLSRTHQRYFLHQRPRLPPSSVPTMDRMHKRSSRMSFHGRRIRPGDMACVLHPLQFRITVHEATATGPASAALRWGQTGTARRTCRQMSLTFLALFHLSDARAHPRCRVYPHIRRWTR